MYIDGDQPVNGIGGLTIRAWIASAAMSGIASNPQLIAATTATLSKEERVALGIARMAVEAADFLIGELNKEKTDAAN